ncbi:GIY-YIG nuclease family protein [Methanobacterium alcaliphilum]|uniref:GIY-YIG nuclease family protein n=1 Tax=Methanobacterium alcaliphilum TaxID=392018 RepID=UPI00200B99E4|nr:GIY-YIG nuclease family protein [Methanobacterium alcaliphilum]MCK9152016.1 GIY-YIG nuclease family protein [Methanobacterium alcaliphilum]
MKGTYCLIIELNNRTNLKVGCIGKLDLKKGFYIYVGSALNSLESRVKRHLSSKKKVHWHIDYFLTHNDTQIREVLFSIGDEKIECNLASNILEKGKGIVNFGCSDCKCSSHLIYFKEYSEALKYTKQAFNKLNIESNNLEFLLSLERT